MRFRISVDVWTEAGSLREAEAALTRVQQAAHDALGPAAVTDATSGAACRGELTPADTAAAEAFAAEDLGPGISSNLFA